MRMNARANELRTWVKTGHEEGYKTVLPGKMAKTFKLNYNKTQKECTPLKLFTTSWTPYPEFWKKHPTLFPYCVKNAHQRFELNKNIAKKIHSKHSGEL